MKLQQLRFLSQVIASNFNVTAAAAVLHTSQSGVSHQIRLLEEELGATIFLRQDKRLLGLTDIGKEVAQAARDMLARADELKSIVADFDESRPGRLTVATTHVHARYALLPVIGAFSRLHRSAALQLIQTFPQEIFQLLDSDKADLGLTTEPPDEDRFDAFPAYAIGRCLIMRVGHPLLKLAKPSLADIARHPMIVYDSRLSSGRTVVEAFAQKGIVPNVALSAVDVDVIKAYVAAGLGVAIVPSLAYEAKADTNLRALKMDHVFPSVMTYIVIRRGKYVRKLARAFMELVAQSPSKTSATRKTGRTR
jgi:LysR family cys regulon transcriptional activator